MNTKLFGLFSGTHLTVVAVAAILAPTALVAAVTYSNVALVNPTTGVAAFVNGSGVVSVYDTIAGYQTSPANYVRLSGSCTTSSNTFTYTPPTGKALILKAADFTYYSATAGNDNYIYLHSSSGFVAGMDSPDTAGSKNSEFGNGYYVRNGQSLVLSCGSTGVYLLSIEGYLVPSAAVPPATPSVPFVKDGKTL